MEQHEIFGGKVHVYRRENSSKWQCSTCLNSRNHRASTRTDSLALAKEFAEDWYLTLKGKSRAGVLKTGRTFREAAEVFEREYETITEGERSKTYVEAVKRNLKVHILPFFGDLVLPISPGKVQEYRVHRATSRLDKVTKLPHRPSRNTLHQETVIVRHVLKTAHRLEWIDYVPNVSPPYKASGKISHRAWFSPEEYKKFYTATRERAKNPKNARWRKRSETLHDYVLFMVNTGLRPDECTRLEFRDVSIVQDEGTKEQILEIEVRGKRGVGYCKSMPGAVLPFQRVKERNKPQPTDLVFGQVQRELFNAILKEQDLKKDRDGRPRTPYSLRHTYICFRLMEGADIYQVAKNCRTSVKMIEEFYAAHIKNVLDASAINIRRKKSASIPIEEGELSENPLAT
jgi:integrase